MQSYVRCRTRALDVKQVTTCGSTTLSIPRCGTRLFAAISLASDVVTRVVIHEVDDRVVHILVAVKRNASVCTGPCHKMLHAAVENNKRQAIPAAVSTQCRQYGTAVAVW